MPEPLMPRSRTRRLLTGAVISGAGLLGATLIVSAVAGAISGCGAPDPTDPINASSVVIVNDTARTVQIDDCVGTWCHQDHIVAGPSKQVIARAACGMSGSDMTSYRVRTAAGAVLGYIAIRSPRSDDHFTYEVSRATPRRDIATPHR